LRTIATDLSIQWGVPLLSELPHIGIYRGWEAIQDAIPACKAWRQTFESQQEQSPDTTSASYNTDLSNTYQHRFDNSWSYFAGKPARSVFTCRTFLSVFSAWRLYLFNQEVQ